MEGIHYVNLMEISPVFMEVQGVENGDLAVSATHLSAAHLSWPLTHNRVSSLKFCKDLKVTWSANFPKKIIFGIIVLWIGYTLGLYA